MGGVGRGEVGLGRVVGDGRGGGGVGWVGLGGASGDHRVIIGWDAVEWRVEGWSDGGV
jgi:hypothetical protein